MRLVQPVYSPFRNALSPSAAAHQHIMQDEPVGVTSAQLPLSAEEEPERSSRPAEQPSRANKQLRSDYSRLSQKRAFPDFCATQSICDLQHSRNTHQHIELITPPPLGHFSHLPVSRAELCAAEPRDSPVGEAEADAASPSSTSVNLTNIQMDSPIAHHLNNGNDSSSTGSVLSGGLGAAFPNLPTQEMQSASGGSSSPSLPGFGTPWSVQTNSSPPPAPNSINPIHANAINQMPTTDSENSFYPGIPSSINPAFFQSFSPVSANPCAGINVQGYSGPFSPQINVPQQPQSRRSPVSPQMHPQQGAFLQQRNNYNQHQVSKSHLSSCSLVKVKLHRNGAPENGSWTKTASVQWSPSVITLRGQYVLVKATIRMPLLDSSL